MMRRRMDCSFRQRVRRRLNRQNACSAKLQSPLDDFRHGHAEPLVDQHHLAACDKAVVDQDVDRLADAAIELEHRARRELQKVADRHARVAEHRRDCDRHVEDLLEIGGALRASPARPGRCRRHLRPRTVALIEAGEGEVGFGGHCRPSRSGSAAGAGVRGSAPATAASMRPARARRRRRPIRGGRRPAKCRARRAPRCGPSKPRSRAMRCTCASTSSTSASFTRTTRCGTPRKCWNAERAASSDRLERAARRAPSPASLRAKRAPEGERLLLEPRLVGVDAGEERAAALGETADRRRELRVRIGASLPGPSSTPRA